VNQYYKFLLIELRLQVPPLSWSIETFKVRQTPLVYDLPWGEMAARVIDGNFAPDVKFAFLLFSRGFGIPLMREKRASRKLLRVNWSDKEREFLNQFPRPIFGQDYLFINKHGECLSEESTRERLNTAIRSLSLDLTHGALRDDARVVQIANTRLESKSIFELYNIKEHGRHSMMLLKLADQVREKRALAANEAE
jgi:hypothetical protein